MLKNIILNEKELDLLNFINRYPLREGYFPPHWFLIYENYNIKDKNEFSELMNSLHNKEVIKIAKGKLRGIFITEKGYDFIIKEGKNNEKINIFSI